MNLFNDPMAAGFIWRVLLLLFAWVMFFVLGRPGPHENWIGILQTLKLVRKDPEEEEESTPLYSKTKVLVVRPANDPTPDKFETHRDYSQAIERSRLVFQIVGVVMVLLVGFHGFQFYRQYSPYLLSGPDTKRLTSPTDHPPLPPQITGAGGGGSIQATVGGIHGPGYVPKQPGQPGISPTNQIPGGAPAPGILPSNGVPGGAPGQPGGPPQPNND